MFNYIKVLSLITLVSFLFLTSSLYSQTNEDCLGCHSDKTLTKIEKGKSVSLFVNKSIIGN